MFDRFLAQPCNAFIADLVRQFSQNFLEESRQPQMLLGNVLLQSLGCVIFFARVYSRAAIIKAWRAEDSMLALAWVSG
jgi:hypothetical protein